MRRFTVRHNYDPAMDATTWRDGYNPIFHKTDDPVKLALLSGKLSASARETNRKLSAVRASARQEREEVEKRAAEAVKRAVAVLEMALHELNDVRAPAQYTKHVNQLQVHNAVFHLKTKCGVQFVESEFSHKAKLDR
jgi:hypothetical protein